MRDLQSAGVHKPPQEQVGVFGALVRHRIRDHLVSGVELQGQVETGSDHLAEVRLLIGLVELVLVDGVERRSVQAARAHRLDQRGAIVLDQTRIVIRLCEDSRDEILVVEPVSGCSERLRDQ